MLSRRDLVGKLAAGAAGALVLATSKGADAAISGSENGPSRHNEGALEQVPPAAVEADAPPATSTAPPPAAPPPWQLLRPLTLGATVAHGWRLADLGGPAAGACVVTLQNERGRTQRVHLCRNDGRPQGLVYTDRFDLVVMNGGRGDLGTDESMAQAVAAIAHVLAANEDGADREVLAALLPHSERVAQFAAANEWILR
jgi:hypothetical protein